MLTEALFKSSKIVRNEMIWKERKMLEFENEILFSDIKSLIDKHYSEVEESLKKENVNLNNKLKEKDNTIKKIKEKISIISVDA